MYKIYVVKDDDLVRYICVCLNKRESEQKNIRTKELVEQ